MKDKAPSAPQLKEGTLFPVELSNGTRSYFYCDFSELLGFGSSGDVYKGYPCKLIALQAQPDSPCRIHVDELNINESTPVAIKIYKNDKPSSFPQVNPDLIGEITFQERVIQIMRYIEGFHVDFDRDNNPELNTFSFLQAVDLAWQLVLGLNQLHSQKVHRNAFVHGDIKGSNIKIHKISQTKTNVYPLDFDYVKPISSSFQHPQGTPEHIALEVLRGMYSEQSDFYALTPVLYSIFGAKNPLINILLYRDAHPSMSNHKLIYAYSHIGFCPEGLFENFNSKPNPIILELLSQFILQMGNRDKTRRPKPDAVLEFFTALRQWSLLQANTVEPPNQEDLHFNLIRLYIASDKENWLNQEPVFMEFLRLPENTQARLVDLMSINHKALLYIKLLESPISEEITQKLKRAIYEGLIQHSITIKQPYWISSLFVPLIDALDIHRLAECFIQNDSTHYFSHKNKINLDSINNLTPETLKVLVKTAYQSLSHDLSRSRPGLLSAVGDL